MSWLDCLARLFEGGERSVVGFFTFYKNLPISTNDIVLDLVVRIEED